MTKISEILKQAKALIADEKNWTQGAAARNEKGQIAYSLDPDATCWCSFGAVSKTTEGDLPANGLAHNQLYDTLEKEFNCTSISEYNDNHTHTEVMSFWDKAIAAAEKQEETE